MASLKAPEPTNAGVCGIFTLCLLLMTAGYSPAQQKLPADRETAFEGQIVRPLAEQLAEFSRTGQEHARRVDSGKIEVIRNPDLADAERTKGWVLLVIGPMERPYYTSAYTLYEAPKWKWSEGRQDRAIVSFDEVLFTKTGDSVKELEQSLWQRTLSKTHEFYATFSDGEWKWEPTHSNSGAPSGVKVPPGTSAQ